MVIGMTGIVAPKATIFTQKSDITITEEKLQSKNHGGDNMSMGYGGLAVLVDADDTMPVYTFNSWVE